MDNKERLYLSLFAILIVSIFALILAFNLAISTPPLDITGTIDKPIIVELPQEIPFELKGIGAVWGSLNPNGNEVAVYNSGPGWTRREAFYPDNGGALVVTWTHESYYVHQLQFMARTCYQIQGQVFAFYIDNGAGNGLVYHVVGCEFAGRLK